MFWFLSFQCKNNNIFRFCLFINRFKRFNHSSIKKRVIQTFLLAQYSWNITDVPQWCLAVNNRWINHFLIARWRTIFFYITWKTMNYFFLCLNDTFSIFFTVCKGVGVQRPRKNTPPPPFCVRLRDRPFNFKGEANFPILWTDHITWRGE
jgi:hypothetical protein